MEEGSTRPPAIPEAPRGRARAAKTRREPASPARATTPPRDTLAHLPTMRGPLQPLTPQLERELWLIFEEYDGDGGALAEAVVSWVFERGLVFQDDAQRRERVAFFPTTRHGDGRMVRVVEE